MESNHLCSGFKGAGCQGKYCGRRRKWGTTKQDVTSSINKTKQKKEQQWCYCMMSFWHCKLLLWRIPYIDLQLFKVYSEGKVTQFLWSYSAKVFQHNVFFVSLVFFKSCHMWEENCKKQGTSTVFSVLKAKCFFFSRVQFYTSSVITPFIYCSTPEWYGCKLWEKNIFEQKKNQ